MEKLAILLFDIGLWSMYLLIALTVALLIQGVVYWTTGFSIYKWLDKKLILDQLK